MRVQYLLGIAATMTLGGGCLQVLVYQEATLDSSCCAGGGGPGNTAATSSSVGGAGGEASCGDGKTQAPEECDNGAENGPQKACKAGCTLNVCGDGDVGPGEKCDEGAQNGFSLFKCAPDCSRIIVKKQIVLSEKQPNGDLGPNPVAHADSLCPPKYKALFAFGDTRRATTAANEVKAPIDWVVSAYTYYYNSEANPIWLTDAVALLGVRNGMFIGLENPVRPVFPDWALTGLAADWTALTGNNCNDWTKSTSGFNSSLGQTLLTDISFIATVDNSADCSTYAFFYCVEQ